MSKRKELVLTRTATGEWQHDQRTVACHDTSLEFFVGLPRDARKAYAVFTDDKPTNNNYTIKKPTPSFSQWLGDKACLIGINSAMYNGGEYLLAEMYEQGYRYLQVEWDA